MPRPPAIAIASFSLAAALTLLLLTAAYERNRSYGSEVALWLAAVDATPGKQRPHHNLGHALAQEGRYQEALQAYDRVLGLREDGSVFMPFFFLAQGKAFFYLDRFDEAIAAWKRALALSPGDPEALTNIAVALLKQGRHREARGYGRSALLSPRAPAEAYEVMGEIALGQGELREAASYFMTALRKKPDLLSAYGSAASAYDALGEHGSALSVIRQYRAAGLEGPEHQELLDMEARLSSRDQRKTGSHPGSNQ